MIGRSLCSKFSVAFTGISPNSRMCMGFMRCMTVNTGYRQMTSPLSGNNSGYLYTMPLDTQHVGFLFRTVHPYSTGSEQGEEKKSIQQDSDTVEGKKLTSRERLKIITTQYGAFGMVFHISISLMSLGLFYFLVYSGVDFAAIMTKFGLESSAITAGASTFLVAYAVHKMFAPVRIGITFISVPVLVKHLRRIGIFKK